MRAADQHVPSQRHCSRAGLHRNSTPTHRTWAVCRGHAPGANLGDKIALELTNEAYPPGKIFSSDPSRSTDGVNHAYITTFSGLIGKADISGYFVGMEDLPNGSSDFDYNDDDFVISGVTTTPEPSTFLLFGTGLLGAAGMLRRKFVR